MIALEEFQKENAEIFDLCQVLGTLIDQYTLRKNPIVCELLDRFIDRVGKHLRHEDRSVYGDLLAQRTPEAKRLASHFLGNTQELKRICKSYEKDWCHHPHTEKEHAVYVKESQQIFKLVCDRIDFENDKIFPVFMDKAA